MLRDVPHAVLAPVLRGGAVADARPLPDAAGTRDRAGRPRGPRAPPAVDCKQRAQSVSGEATYAGRAGCSGGSTQGWQLGRGVCRGPKLGVVQTADFG